MINLKIALKESSWAFLISRMAILMLTCLTVSSIPVK